MRSRWISRAAVRADLPAVSALLEAAGLPTSGVAEALPYLVVADAGGRVVAAAAFERHGDAALLRSVVVEPALRGRGVGAALVEDRLDSAAVLGIRDVYLLTTSADGYFTRHGFRTIDRADAPEPLRQSAEFASLCPCDAVAMRRSISTAPAAAEAPR